jgi:hypothetical protein
MFLQNPPTLSFLLQSGPCTVKSKVGSVLAACRRPPLAVLCPLPLSSSVVLGPRTPPPSSAVQELRRWVTEEQHPAAYSALPRSKTSSASPSFPSRAILLVLRSSSSRAPPRTAPPHKLDAIAQPVAAKTGGAATQVSPMLERILLLPCRRWTWWCCCFRWSSPLKIRRNMEIQFAVSLNIELTI